jgi:hypothetical protein
MNAITAISIPDDVVALALPDELEFAQWIEMGKTLFARHRNTEWMLADWLKVGSERFHDEAQFGLFLDELGVDQKRAIADAKVAKLIPPAWRSDKVSFEVCKHIAKVEDEELRLRMLRQAVEGHWNEKQAHHAVVEHKSETGQLLPDDDATSRLSTEIVRCWNRAGPDAREYFFALAEMAAATGYGPIDEDAVI